MGRFLVVTWEGGGNVTPMARLADGLVARGHDVGAVAPERLRGRFDAAGAELVSSPAGWLATADEVVDAVERFEPDALVVDYMLTGALCGAERSGRPTAALVHTLYGALLVDGAPNPIGMAGSVDDLNTVRGALGLAPIERHADLMAACEVVVVGAPRHLDVEPDGGLGDRIVYAGPLVDAPDPSGRAPGREDGAEDPRPLVVVSMGTAGADPDREAAVIGRILDALRGLDVRAMVNLPDYLDPSAFDAPAGVEIAGFVRHADVLPDADLVVTHAGLGTVNAALAHGVPMVCLPLDREQPDNALAVERIGAGVALDPDVGVDELRAAIHQQLAADRTDPVAVDVGPTIARLEALASD